MSYKLEDFFRDGDWKEWAKSLTENGDGGYLVPETVNCPVKGIVGKFYRLINNKRGWYEYHLYDEIMKRRNNGKNEK
jgi:hypothetical protein